MDRLTPTILKGGQAWPLGVTVQAGGLNVAVASAHATAIDLCVFDADAEREVARWRLGERSGDVWYGWLPGAGPGLIYGLRAHGPWRPAQGHRFDPSKLLLDPYARDIVGSFIWSEAHFSRPGVAHDNAAFMLKARVPPQDTYDWEGDTPICLTPEQRIVLEAHVKGLTRLHPDIPPQHRGRYAALGHPALLAHLRALGVTVLSLLPIHTALSEERLVAQGLSNYWGYNTLGFFCPDARFATPDDPRDARAELRDAVKALHKAGIAVVLDVVFNHSAEGGADGPTLSFRGLDNATYYRRSPIDGSDENASGCGNTLDVRQPRVLQLVMDSLRHWVQTYHVDGFRFDLAPVLGRGDAGFSARSAFFMALAQDPVLTATMCIAEPWDVAPGGYQLGGFPAGWLEWNDRYRDTLRRFWVVGGAPGGGGGVDRAELALRLCGSADVFQGSGRAPWASVNYVVSHDGFTLRDLVSYAQRHNLANGEANRDGTGANHSANGGVEGDTDAPALLAWRAAVRRALLACTLLAQGTPMLAAGDELGHTQQGNNNPYCQDNPLTWIDWAQADPDMLQTVKHLAHIRRALQPFLLDWYSGQTDATGVRDLDWTEPDGRPISAAAWHDPGARALWATINRPGRARSALALGINGGHLACRASLPPGQWQTLLDTSQYGARPGSTEPIRTELTLPATAVVLLQRVG